MKRHQHIQRTRVWGALLLLGLLLFPLPAEAKRRRAPKSKSARRSSVVRQRAPRPRRPVRKPSRPAAHAPPPRPLYIPPLEQVSARAMVLMDAKTGQVLFERNADARMYPASCTKIMTALLALERGNLDDKVKASVRASRTQPSNIQLKSGETLTLRQLLYALMLKSANDAAVAIAEHIGGSVEQFARLMNERAREIGCTETHFVTPHGLHAPEHHSTARDLARIAQAALTNPQFCDIATTHVMELPWAGKPWRRKIYNKNKLLSLFAGADGVKTGFTTPAGRCFVASATRDGWQLIAVVLHCDNIWQDAAGLLTYGFNSYRLLPLVRKGKDFFDAPVADGTTATCRAQAADDIVVPCLKHRPPRVERHIEWRTLQAPVKRGRRAGMLTVSLEGQPVGTVPLLTAEEVPLSWQAIVLPWVKTGGWGTLGLLIGVWGYGAFTKGARARRRRVAASRRTAD